MSHSILAENRSVDSAFSPPTQRGAGLSDPLPLPPPPESGVDKYGLTFGTVCGICAGVFVKRGAKILAFFLGGIFVLLQVSAEPSLVLLARLIISTHERTVPWVCIHNQSRLVKGRSPLREPHIHYRNQWDQTTSFCLFAMEMAGGLYDRRFPTKGVLYRRVCFGN